MTAESKVKILRDPAAETAHLTPDGKRKTVKRDQGHKEKTDETPIVRAPDSLLEKPIRVWTD